MSSSRLLRYWRGMTSGNFQAPSERMSRGGELDCLPMVAQVDLGIVATLVSALVALSGLIVWAVRFLAGKLVDALRDLRSELRRVHADVRELQEVNRQAIGTLHEHLRTLSEELRAERKELFRYLQQITQKRKDN